MNHFETLGHNVDTILACPDEDLRRLGLLEYVQALRGTISDPNWGKIELMFAVMADAITRKEQQNGN